MGIDCLADKSRLSLLAVALSAGALKVARHDRHMVTYAKAKEFLSFPAFVRRTTPNLRSQTGLRRASQSGPICAYVDPEKVQAEPTTTALGTAA